MAERSYCIALSPLPPSPLSWVCRVLILIQSQVPHHHQQVHTPSSPSPSTPTGTYSTSHPSFNYVTPSSPRQTMCPMSYQYGLFQYPSRTSTPQYTCSQSSAHMPFMRGMMEIKKQIAAGSCKPPQAATKQQQRQKIVNTVDTIGGPRQAIFTNIFELFNCSRW